jgi:alkyl hydroperoxide reductase subunit AhpC
LKFAWCGGTLFGVFLIDPDGTCPSKVVSTNKAVGRTVSSLVMLHFWHSLERHSPKYSRLCPAPKLETTCSFRLHPFPRAVKRP